MFKLKYYPLLAMLLVTSQSFALNDTENRFYQQLISGDLTLVKHAARGIAKRETDSIEILDLMAELLLQHFPLNYIYEVDSLAWGCRALGASGNPRYQATLETLVAQSENDKLIKYAKKALKQIKKSNITEFTQYVAGSVDLKALEKTSSFRKLSKSKYQGSDLNLYYITSNDLFNIKRLSQRILSQSSSDLKVTDALAQFIANNHLNATNHNADTLAWSCKALGSTGLGRYRELLERVVDDTNSRAMRKHCDNAADDLPAQGPYYQDGDVDLAKILKALN